MHTLDKKGVSQGTVDLVWVKYRLGKEFQKCNFMVLLVGQDRTGGFNPPPPPYSDCLGVIPRLFYSNDVL